MTAWKIPNASDCKYMGTIHMHFTEYFYQYLSISEWLAKRRLRAPRRPDNDRTSMMSILDFNGHGMMRDYGLH